jgi:hypothetical protein
MENHSLSSAAFICDICPGRSLALRSESAANRYFPVPMQYRCCVPRKKIWPCDTAGEAYTGSFKGFFASTSNVLPAFNTHVTPASSGNYNRPSARMPEALWCRPSCSFHNRLPVWASMHPRTPGSETTKKCPL